MKKTKKSVKKINKKIKLNQEIALPEPQKTEEVKVDYVKLFEKWLLTYSWIENGGIKYLGSEEFLEANDIGEIIKNLPPQWHDQYFVDSILRVTHISSLANPLHILSALNYDGGMPFAERIINYLEKTPEQKWNLSFLDLVSRMDSPMDFLENISWAQNQEDLKGTFVRFAKGSILESSHSMELYCFLFDLFFGGASQNPSFICSRLSGELSANRDPVECAKLMSGIIKMAKKDIFLWDFEEFLS